MKKNHDFLVFTSAGEQSCLHKWLKGKPNFDLWVTYYGDHDGKYSDLTKLYDQRKDTKFPNLHALHNDHPDFLAQYKAILVMDDDIGISAKQINKLFAIQQECDFWVLQASFDRRGKISHSITRQRYGYKVRYTNFVEMTCPLFRTDKLTKFLEVFDPDLKGWGTDHWFMHALGADAQGHIAIIDSISCLNPHDKFKTNGIREIDNYQSANDRKAHFEKISKDKNILKVSKAKNFKRIRKSVPAALYALIAIKLKKFY
ncbi:MAG: hypothetical protein GYB20_00860 [Oceanospirillales bacterium]|nr:hypothetical protein [Oceanospirillales bacterium]MBR9886238.1 hypothetical protein [Oceanospirillales bacterium]